MGAMASQIISLAIVYSTVHSGADKKTSKLRVIGLCEGNSPVTGEFPAQMASDAESISKRDAWKQWSHTWALVCSSDRQCLGRVAASTMFIRIGWHMSYIRIALSMYSVTPVKAGFQRFKLTVGERWCR